MVVTPDPSAAAGARYTAGAAGPYGLLACVPDGATLILHSYAGRYAIEGTALCTVAHPGASPSDAGDADIRPAVAIGDTRTMQQDVSYGVRQLADVALRALSPGINDPTTAQDAIFHL
ncbi:MAG TPA: DUF2254 family protein, partial [Acidimicrobiales bacterium]|nr:DUF2254 family protein [Acidimicrobiales bacterium]